MEPDRQTPTPPSRSSTKPATSVTACAASRAT